MTNQTATDRVLSHLKRGRTLTKMQAFDKFNTVHLGDCIYRIRRKGYKVQTDMVTRNGKTFAKYWLPARSK